MAVSAPVVSSQKGRHPRLDAVVRRHFEQPWRQPVRDHTRRAFEAVASKVSGHGGPLVLDSGCGTGASTAALARHHAGALVIGVDKSAARLNKSPDLPENAVLVRADLADFWRLAAAGGWRLDDHYLLYPNPWPKSEHLMRRWHAHPVFPDLLALGGRLEVRSNWRIYLEEFARALELAGYSSVEFRTLHATAPISPFERKYRASGHELYGITVELKGKAAGH